MVEIETKLTGDIEGALDKYAAEIQGAVLLSGVAAMARVIYDEVKANAHQRTISGNPREHGREPGTLESAIYRAYAKEASTDEVKIYKVSVNKKKAPHWFLVEYGTFRSRAYPYIRPAFDKVNAAIDAGLERMKALITQRPEGGSIINSAIEISSD